VIPEGCFDGLRDLTPLSFAKFGPVFRLESNLLSRISFEVSLDSSIAARPFDCEELPLAFGLTVEQLNG
jgi:hypothetical protein